MWKDKVMQNINYISSFLVANGATLSKQEMFLWAETLDYSKILYKQQFTEAAIHVVDFSLRSKENDPSILLKASFPVVYKTFLKGKSLTNLIGSVLFSDWDKCKTLRHDLVSRYLDNNWDIYGLFEVASKTNILDEVTNILRETKRGRKILEEVSKSSMKKQSKKRENGN